MVPGENSVWELFSQDGEMKMYKREELMDGRVVDPLKALHQIKGNSDSEN
jgi:collagen type IV alpha-3-binding protein